MSEIERRGIEVATAISDGEVLDWSSVERLLAPGDGGDVVRELRALTKVAEYYRDLQNDPEADTIDAGSTGPSRPAAGSSECVADGPGTWGHLELVKQVGEGSFGEVFLARDPNLDRTVALKLATTARLSTPAGVASAIEEGRKLARVRHPNVVTVFGADRHDDRIGIWMEFIQGRTLRDIVRDDGPLGEREAALIGLDLCRALAAVHKAGLVHRDVKAHNVMREQGGRVVLMDLGTSVEAAPGPDGGTVPRVAGTPVYMAPELFTGTPASVSSDVYALGVLLYYLVSGRHPVEAGSWRGLAERHRRREFMRLRDVRPDVSLGFVRVIERALAPRPESRFAGPAAFEDALSAVVTGSTVSGERAESGANDRRVAPRRRNRLTIAVTALALGTAAFALWRGGVLTGSPGYTIEASFYRDRNGAAEHLRAGDRVRVGDQFFLDLSISRPLHVYVINQDERGESWLLFPLSGLDLTNPVEAGRHRLPGHRGDEEELWGFSSAGGREHLVVIASEDPIEALDLGVDLSTLATPSREGAPPGPQEIPAESMARLRGAGFLAARPRPGATEGAGRLYEMALPIDAGGNAVSGVFLRELTLENPVE